MSTEILTVGEVFADATYFVPVYQRAYAWGPDQIETLLRDVRDYREVRDTTDGARAGSYFIGSLVTHMRSDHSGNAVHEVVDGQQRLTTLFLVMGLLADGADPDVLTGKLTYEGRKRSAADLALVARDRDATRPESLVDTGISQAAQTILAAKKHGEFNDLDLRYLLDRVRIVRTTLPPRTDLNHYFEVMNSRGEQLEKHEIVKAKLMGILSTEKESPESVRAFARIWDACSDLSRHVQRAFPSDERTGIFGDTWDTFSLSTYDEVASRLNSASASDSTTERTLDALLASGAEMSPGQLAEDASDATELFGSIIDFPNLLLQVLALTIEESDFVWGGGLAIALDDKRLVEEFDKVIHTATQVKTFCFNLLQIRYLFDRFVIKTDKSKDGDDDSNWVLRRARRLESASATGRKAKLSPIATYGQDDGDQASDPGHLYGQLVLLQSMFQVTDSRRSYKNFLYAILQYLHRGTHNPSPAEFIAFLEQLAADRFANTDTTDLNAGTLAPHYVFNYLDYLLWKGGVAEHPSLDPKAFANFRFRYRKSVEHFYPQNPDANSLIGPLDQKVVDRFGNLCLMTNSENSQRSNLAPLAKIGQYRSEAQSLKFQLMAEMAKQSDGWGEHQIEVHGSAVLRLLRSGE